MSGTYGRILVHRGGYLVAGLFLALLCADCSGSYDEMPAISPDEDYRITQQKVEDASSAEAKRDLWLQFLERNPQSRYLAEAVDRVAVEYYLEEKADPAQAVTFVRTWIDSTQNTESRGQLQDRLIELLGSARQGEELARYVEELRSERELTLEEIQAVCEAAIQAEAWQLSRKESEFLLEQVISNPLLGEGSQPGSSSSPQQERLLGLRSSALLTLGWSLTQLDENEAALARFEQLKPSIEPSYVGFTDWPTEHFDRYYATALVRSGDYSAAVETIAPKAVIQQNPEALSILRQAYEAQQSGAKDFEAFVRQTATRIARPMPGFTVFDYQGKAWEYDEVSGKVTLVVFWFPT